MAVALSACGRQTASPAAKAEPASVAASAGKSADYSHDIQPLLAAQCYQCHGPDAENRKAGLRLDDRAALVAFAGTSGARALVPGKPEASELIRRIETHDDDERMPRNAGKRLTDAQNALLRDWIAQGAPFAAFWAFEPPKGAAAPPVKNATWCATEVDTFILSALEAKGLAPAARADRATLLRRLSFDLTGLPPTPAEVAAFEADPAPEQQAWDTQVDRLLASQAFGEKWASHWLDLAHYAETYGHEFDFEMATPWHYRDYVIRAFNADVPYDRFLREQIAGDLLPDPRRNPQTGANESVLGPAFWRLGEDMHSPVDLVVHQSDRVDNQIDTFSKTFHGLTVSCARCHDHKFDPISQKDYAALFGVFSSTRYALQPVDDGPAHDKLLAEVRTNKTALEKALAPAPYAAKNALETPPATTRLPLPSTANPAGWSAVGLPLADLLAAPGAIAPGETADAAVARRWLATGADSALLGRRAESMLRSPTFAIRQRFLHVRAAGAGARLNLCVEGFKIIRDPLYGSLHRPLENPNPHWLTFDLSRWQPEGVLAHNAWFELLDAVPADPSLGSHPANGWFALAGAVLSDDSKSPALPPPWETPAIAADPALFGAWQKAANALVPRPWCISSADGTGCDYAVPLRGSPHKPGPVSPRRGLAVLSGDKPFASAGSGRLELADSLLTPNHPLTSRVMVNRLWHHLFGRGLVASTDNFGVLGDRPSHPALLDALALKFQGEDQWSVKAAIRRMVRSSTYRMGAQPSSRAAEEADPNNLLLHRQNLRRLPAEAIRDALLAVAGKLDPKMGGPPVPVWLDQNGEGRGRPEPGPLDGAGRRTLYISVRRNFPSSFLAAFDRPQPAFTVGRRSVTNVPAQALSMMNDPLVHAMAVQLAARVRQAETAESGRIRLLYRLTLARTPTEDEAKALTAFLAERQAAGDGEDAAWSALAHAMLQLKEFIYLS